MPGLDTDLGGSTSSYKIFDLEEYNAMRYLGSNDVDGLKHVSSSSDSYK